MTGPPPRRLPERPLPAYAYLPGRDPHPTRDPAGHMHGAEDAPPPRVAPERWRDSEAYLWGVDLYNQGYLWEAHEAWEGLWHVSKHDPVQADHLQGLIQCAAAALKIPMGQPAGLAKLAERGLGRLRSVAERAGPRYMGVDLPRFIGAFHAFALSTPDSADDRPPLELED